MKSEKICWILSSKDVLEWIPFLSDVTSHGDSLIFCEVIVFGDVSSSMVSLIRDSLSLLVSLVFTPSLEDALQHSLGSSLSFLFFMSESYADILSPYFDKVFSVVVHRDLSFKYVGQDADLFFDVNLAKRYGYSLRSFSSVICHDFFGLVESEKKENGIILFELESDINDFLISSLLAKLDNGCWILTPMEQDMAVVEKKNKIKSCDFFVPSSFDNNYWKQYAVINKKTIFDSTSLEFVDWNKCLLELFKSYCSLSVKDVINRILLRNSIHAHSNCWKR